MHRPRSKLRRLFAAPPLAVLLASMTLSHTPVDGGPTPPWPSSPARPAPDISQFEPALILPLVFCFAALLIVLVNPRDYLARLLCGPVALYLGEISYSLYMVHSPWRELLKRTSHRLGIDLSAASGMAFSVVTALALAALVYHTVEMPARHFLRGRKARAPQETELTSLSHLKVSGFAEPSRDRTVG